MTGKYFAALAWAWMAGAMAAYLWQFLAMADAIRGSLLR
jgi:hypothetical protein